MTAPIGRRGIFRDFATLTAGTGAGPALALAISPVLTRLFTPAELGEFALFIALLGIEVAVCLGYERAALLPREPQERFDVLAAAVVAVSATSVLVTIILWIFGPHLIVLSKAPALGAVRYLLPVALFASGCQQALTGWCIATRRLTRIGVSRFVQALTAAGTQVSWGWLGGGAMGLALGQCLGLVSGAATLAGGPLGAVRGGPLLLDASRVARALYRYRHFVISSGGALMNVATLQLPILTLSVRFGIDTAGWLGLAQRVAAGPVNLLVTATGQVFMSRVVEPVRGGDRAGVAVMFRKLVAIQSCVALICAPVLLLAPALFALVFGEQWRESGTIVQILGVALVAQFVFSPAYGLLSLLERQGVYFLVEFTRLLLLGGALLISTTQHKPLHPTLVYIAVASASGYLVAAAATYRGIRQMARTADLESRHR